MDDKATVQALLAAAGLRPTEDELEALTRAYPMVRGMADLLYAVEDVRYGLPAQRFEVEPG